MLALVGCVNRGQRPPDGSGGGGGISGGAGDAGPVDVVDGRSDGGGGSGTICVPTDAGGVVDAGDAAPGCNSFMNFENCVVYGAELPEPDVQTGFTAFSAVSSPTSCGSGALSIRVNLMPGEADVTHVGELLLTIPNGPIDLGGKTLTVHVATSLTSTNLINFYLTPVRTDMLYGSSSAKVSPIRETWGTGSTSFPIGEPLVARFSVQVRGTIDYAATIYVDEIQITPTPPDGGFDVGDGGGGDGSDTRTDTRDGPASDAPAGDVRDATAGN